MLMDELSSEENANKNDDKVTNSDFFESIKGNYEKRIREMSSPEKVFEYFASDKRGPKLYDCFMTPADFIRSISPFSRDAVYLKQNDKYLSNILSVIDMNGDGLISFNEFILLTALLSIPSKYASIAFRLFDADGSGSLDRSEFMQFLKLIQQSNPLAASQRTLK
jgi:calcium uptake protein 1, mitochondrial